MYSIPLILVMIDAPLIAAFIDARAFYRVEALRYALICAVAITTAYAVRAFPHLDAEAVVAFALVFPAPTIGGCVILWKRRERGSPIPTCRSCGYNLTG